MRILVIGGSYFFGRVFVMLGAEKHDITVVNRGTYSMEEFGARQVRGDRHDPGLWKECGGTYDAVVDFCAYQPEDVSTVLENLPGKPEQYILISTVDVYRRTGFQAAEALPEEISPKDRGSAPEKKSAFKEEKFPLEERYFPGEAGNYIAGKVSLEHELRRECGERGIAYTILRPAILYGPYNYAPRESWFIGMAVREHVIPRFTDASGRFQFVYVKDAAEAVLRCLGNEVCRGQAYNLCGDEVLDYDLFFGELAACMEESGTLPMTLAEAGERGIPVPFPALAKETELVSNRKSREELGLEYTPLHQGMLKTCRAFRRVYVS